MIIKLLLVATVFGTGTLASSSALATPPREAATLPTERAETPEWQKLTWRLEQLQRQRVALLTDRTPSHPVVRCVELRLAELQRQMEDVPRWAVAPQLRAPESPTRPALPPPNPATASRKVERPAKEPSEPNLSGNEAKLPPENRASLLRGNEATLLSGFKNLSDLAVLSGNTVLSGNRVSINVNIEQRGDREPAENGDKAARTFLRLDANGDGQISPKEFRRAIK